MKVVVAQATQSRAASFYSHPAIPFLHNNDSVLFALVGRPTALNHMPTVLTKLNQQLPELHYGTWQTTQEYGQTWMSQSLRTDVGFNVSIPGISLAMTVSRRNYVHTFGATCVLLCSIWSSWQERCAAWQLPSPPPLLLHFSCSMRMHPVCEPHVSPLPPPCHVCHIKHCVLCYMLNFDNHQAVWQKQVKMQRWWQKLCNVWVSNQTVPPLCQSLNTNIKCVGVYKMYFCVHISLVRSVFDKAFALCHFLMFLEKKAQLFKAKHFLNET